MGIDAGRAVDLSGIVSQSAREQSAIRESGNSVSSNRELMLPGLALHADDASFASVLDISNTVPVIVCLVRNVDTDEPMIHALNDAVLGVAGQVVLVTVDAAANPQLASSFQVDAMSAAEGGASPVVAAVIAGRPLPLFVGSQPVEVIRQVVEQLCVVASESGVTGRVVTPDMDGTAAGSVPDGEGDSEPEVALTPLHQEAFDAIERGEYPAAVAAYERALVENPRDDMARAGLAQVSLINRLQGKSLADVRNAAAENPDDVAAALDVADLDVSGGHIEDAFERLLSLFARADKDARETIRTRLVQLFEVVGVTDARVVAARAKLSALLY